MTDVHSTSVRSKNMRAIKRANTRPELLLRRALHARGFRFRLHARSLPGSPDIVLAKYKTAIFVNGCFWHGHRCRFSTIPKTRTEFWLAKISDNISRDQINGQKLLDAGWRVAVVWECAFKGQTAARVESQIDYFVDWLTNTQSRGIELVSPDP